MKIYESTSHLRKKKDELKDLGKDNSSENDHKKHLSDGGFLFEDTTFKLQGDQDEEPLAETYKPNSNTAKNVDLRKYFTPVKFQGNVGACTVYSLTSIYEYILKRVKNEQVDLSERFVYHQICAKRNMQDTGSSVLDVVSVMQQQGICSEQQCPDIKRFAEEPSQNAYEDALTHRLHTAKQVNVNRLDFQSALSEGYPVLISLKIFDSFGQNSNGFIDYPTDEELAGNTFGWHAMVIVGYVEEHKIYIVRNSWGENFGDKGYCFIPFEYVENPDLNRTCCIITKINDGEEVKKETVNDDNVSQINSLSNELKINIIQEELRRENHNIKKNENEFKRLQKLYTQIEEICGRPDFRTNLFSDATTKLEDEYNDLDTQYKSMFSERPDVLKFYKKKTRKDLIIWGISTFLFFVAFILFVCLKEFQNTFTYILLFGTAASALGLAICRFIRKRNYKELDENYQNHLAEIEKKKTKNREIKDILDIKIHFAGLLIDTLSPDIIKMNNTYTALKDYVIQLNEWKDESDDALQTLSPRCEPFVNLLDNARIETYFNNNGDSLIESLQLYDFFENYYLQNQNFGVCKKQILTKIESELKNAIRDFQLYRFVDGERPDYFRDDKSKDALFDLLTKKSQPFLHYSVIGLEDLQKESSYVFLFMPQADENKISTKLRNAFVKAPAVANISAWHKIVMVQKQNIRIEDLRF